ncbi:hypothetical protein AB8Q28_28565, partial [Klebsiella variicola]|uniref:hypothetical protein n=1 Tax=Klebsiella variicola TaxID=244366 RepID=UPI0038CFDB89
KTLLHGDVLMWLMKTLLTSGCTNQRGAGQFPYPIFSTEGILYQLKTGTVDTEQKSSTQPESARR